MLANQVQHLFEGLLLCHQNQHILFRDDKEICNGNVVTCISGRANVMCMLCQTSVTSHKGAPPDEGDDTLVPRLFYTDASAFL